MNAKRTQSKNGNSLTGEIVCPVCGQEYAKKATIQRGIRWADFAHGSVFDHFSRFRRRCSASIDVEAEEQRLKRDEMVLYFHGDTSKEV